MNIDANGNAASLYEFEAWTMDGVNAALTSGGAKSSVSSFALANQTRHFENLTDGSVDRRQAFPWVSAKSGAAWLRVDFAQPVALNRITWHNGSSVPVDYTVEVLWPDGGWQIVVHTRDRLPRGDDMRVAGRVTLKNLTAEQAQVVVTLIAEIRMTKAEISRLAAGPQTYAASFTAKPYEPRQPHFTPRATSVIEIFCAGALSHVDTFDHKPELIRRHGQPLPGNEKLVSFQGPNGNLTRPLWQFRPRGQCGEMVSDLVPHIGAMVDDISFLHSLTNTSNTHGPAENVLNTGFAFDGFPSMGAWLNYALGSENQNLPAFVAIEDPRGMPQSGPNNWASGFLPAAFQGTPFSSTKPVRFLQRSGDIPADQTYHRLIHHPFGNNNSLTLTGNLVARGSAAMS